MQELDGAPASTRANRHRRNAEPRASVVAPGRSRDNPVEATFLSRRRLNSRAPKKTTWHVEFDLAGSGLDYVVGDSLRHFSRNDPGLVDAVLAALDAPPDFPIGEARCATC